MSLLIDRHELIGWGIGYVDVHLLASSRLNGALLWKRDKRVRAVAAELRLAHAETRTESKISNSPWSSLQAPTHRTIILGLMM